MKTLQAYHEPYEKISIRQIKLARSHAKKTGPRAEIPKIVKHRVHLDTNKVDNFVYFINRPYFYQDVGIQYKKAYPRQRFKNYNAEHGAHCHTVHYGVTVP